MNVKLDLFFPIFGVKIPKVSELPPARKNMDALPTSPCFWDGPGSPNADSMRQCRCNAPRCSNSNFQTPQTKTARVDATGCLMRKNTAPVDMENLPLFTGFYTCQVVSRISEPSTVVLAD